MNFFINGWGSTADVWQDLPSQGDFCYDISQRTDYADLLSEFDQSWQKNKCQPLSVSGWSLGSLLALKIAEARPEKVKRLFLFGATAHFAGEEDADCQRPIIVKNMLRHLRRDRQKTVTDFWDLMFAPSEEAFRAAFSAQFGVPEGEGALAYGLSYLLSADMREKLARINAPVTLIHGEKDAICPLASAQYLKDNLPCAKLMIFDGCGHVPFFTRKADCRALLKEEKG